MNAAKKCVVSLNGGLGNQLFVASCGLALAGRLGATLYFDRQRLARKRPDMLTALDPYPHGAKIWERLPQFRDRAVHRIKRAVAGIAGKSVIRALPGWHGAVFAERGFHYDPAIEAIESDIFLAGYFQSPRYFAGHETVIRRAFEPSEAASERAKSFAARLAGENTVSLHLRRGDYASNANNTATHGILSGEYYDCAVALLRRVAADPRIFIFSDSPSEAARICERWPEAEAVTGFNDKDDLFLMSRCRHHIIANSSFSWWGAWLDGRPDSIVVAPRAWFSRDKMLNTLVNDLFPAHWITLG